jgi:uncharacterized protein
MKRSRSVRIGVIADTHGLYDVAIKEHFATVGEILHAGDIGDRSVVERLKAIAPVTAVSGNIDEYEGSGFPRQVIIHRGSMTIAVCHVLYEKGKLTEEARAWLDREQPDVCVFGHSHRPTVDRYGTTILFNPGSAGPKRFTLPRGIGILTISRGKAKPFLIRLPDRVEGTKKFPTKRTERTKGKPS